MIDKDVILIIGAMKDVELNILLDKLELKNVVEEKSCTFYEGNLLGNSVVIPSGKILSLSQTKSFEEW